MPNVYEVITQRIIHQLESGTAPWHRPWKARGKSGLPRNLVSGREYRGINVWILLSSGYASPSWLTFRQARELGGHVRKGETGVPVVFWRFGTREFQDGDEIIEKKSVLCRYYTVFNLEQCEGIPSPEKHTEPLPDLNPIEACANIVDGWATKPSIQHGGDRASYHKLQDCVRMPMMADFDHGEAYYSTLFHELTHSTGHPSRLNRSTLMDAEAFGDEAYSREELIAEMGAAFLCGITGIENKTINNSSSYLQSWLQVLRSDSRLVLVAAGQAQKAVDLILSGPARSDADQQPAG